MKFPQLIAAIAFELLWNDDFFGAFQTLGARTADWPELSPPRVAAEEYLRLRESNGHLFAQHQLLSTSARLEELRGTDPLPTELEVLQPLYARALKRHRVESLAHELAYHPDRADELITAFQRGQDGSCVDRELREWVSEWAPRREQMLDAGTMRITLPGWEHLSDMIGGFNPGRLAILLADTGFGKTNLGLRLATAAAREMSTLYVNMEMTPHDITDRVVVSLLGITYSELNRRGGVDHERLSNMADALRLRITDGKDLSVEQVKAKIRYRASQRALGFVVVDYDQKLVLETDRNTPEWKALQNAVVSLEGIAKECSCFVLLLAQTNEEGAISGSRRSTFPAAVVLRFFQDDAPTPPQTVIQAVKNRFGRRHAAISVEYDPERSAIREIGKTIVASPKKERRSIA